MKPAMCACVVALFAAQDCNAIIIIPLPNLGFPPAVEKLRDALEKSTDTKALATVGEDKTFGSRQWTWGYTSGKMTQADANDRALRMCEANLVVQKNQTAGGQPLYNFGSRSCELYKFTNVTLSLPDPPPPPPPPPPPAPVAPAVVSTPAVSETPPPQAPAPAPASSPAPAAAPALVVPANTPPAAIPNSAGDIVQKMRDLDALYKQNLITKEEYERKKKQLLDTL